jgi:hypothetical protein
MAIEFPNTLVAAGLFDPTNILALPSPPPGGVLSQRGFLAYDQATTPLAPVGGFTRIAVGDYLLKLEEGLDPLEGIALATPHQSVTPQSVLATILAGPPIPAAVPTADDGRSVFVDASERCSGARRCGR